MCSVFLKSVMCDRKVDMCISIVPPNAISTQTSRQSFPRQRGCCNWNGCATSKCWRPSGHRRTILGPTEEESFSVSHQVSLVHHPR